MADRNAIDLTVRPPKLLSPLSPLMSHPICRPNENTMRKDLGSSLSTVEVTPNKIFPEPAYVDGSAVSQVVTSSLNSCVDKNSGSPLVDVICIAPSSLAIVNCFLDHLLFDILSNSQTLAMPMLRPAVIKVLRPTLGSSAIQRADLELKGYLDGSENSILPDMSDAIDLVDNADVYMLWKKTRLRCMLYPLLGEIEVKNELLPDSPSVAMESMIISPAVVIFLTSVLEFMGDQLLAVAGGAAYRRSKSRWENCAYDQNKNVPSIVERLAVEDIDVEHIAFDKTLGELWTAWRESKRPTGTCSTRPRTGSQVLRRSLPHLKDIQQNTVFKSLRKQKSSSLLLARLAHLDLATSIPKPQVSSDLGEVKLPPPDKQNQSETMEDFFTYHSRLIRPKSCSLITPENNYHGCGAKKRRANSVPQSTRPQFPRTFKRLKTLSKTEQERCHHAEEDARIVNESSLNSSESLFMLHEKYIRNQNHASSSDDNTTVPNSTAQITPEPHKTTDNLSSNNSICSGKSSENKRLSNHSKNTDSSQSINLDEVRSPQFVENFRSFMPKNSPNRSRRISYQGESKAEIAIRTRPTSLFIPRTTRNDQFYVNEHSKYPIPPISLDLKTRSHSVEALSKSQLYKPENFRHVSENDLRKRKSTLVLDEPNNELDEPLSREIANFAAAVQGVNIYNSDSSYDISIKEDEKTNHNSWQSNSLYAESFSNNYVEKERLCEFELDENVSPMSLLKDEPEFDGYISPVSAASSIERTLDQVIPPRTSHRNLISTSSEDISPDLQPKRVTPQSNSVSSQSNHRVYPSNSRSSSNSHKRTAVLHSEEQTVGKFEQLIQSDQTLQYTLTPQTVRGVEISDPHQRFVRKSSEQGSTLINAVPSSSSKYSVLETARSKNSLREADSVRTFTSATKPSSLTDGRRRSGAPQPRDARIERDRFLSDFANFIRNTGPEFSPSNNPSSFTEVSSTISQKQDPQLVRHSSSRSLFHRRLDSASSHKKFTNRDVSTKRSDSLSGFIDFVLSGPKVEDPNISISYDQTSFNSPTPSNQSWGANDNKYTDALHIDPRHWQNSPSINSSVTSQSALLVNSSKNRTSTVQSRGQLDVANKISTRKTRKIRDPYSLDFLDEENGEKNYFEFKPAQSESLAEFLRNTSPADILDANASDKTNKVNISAPGLLSLFGRRPVSPQNTSKGILGSIVSYQSAGYSSGSKKSANFHSNQSWSHNSQADVPRSNFSHKSLEPREATSRVRTDDLAKFLMHHDPPPSMNENKFDSPLPPTKNPKVNPSTQHKSDVSSFHRMFSRKRASTVSKP